MGYTVKSAVKSGFLNIAHRGARSLAPENTLAAARKALSAGAHMWEIDVRLSRDGHLVVVHDKTLERTSDAPARFPDRKPWAVRDFSLAELQSLDCGSWFNGKDPFGRIAAREVSIAEQAQYCGESMPTLEEALTFTVQNDWLVNIEIKDLTGTAGHGEVAEKTADLVGRLGACDRVLVSSFNYDYLARVKKADARILTAPLTGEALTAPVDIMRSLGAATFHPALRALRPRALRRLKESGFGVLVWVVNRPQIARLLLRAGVAGIFTDFPQNLGPVIKSEKERFMMRSRKRIR